MDQPIPNTAIPFDNFYARDLQDFYEPCQPARAPLIGEVIDGNAGVVKLR